MNAPFKQTDRLGRLTTALGPDALVLLRFDGGDYMNELFEYRVEALAPTGDIDFDQLIGTHATVELSGRGGLRFFDGIVTQNVDNLHQEAGSRRVVEFHGNGSQLVCPGCGTTSPAAEVDRARLPPRCGCGAVLKPDVVMFGELLPAAAFARAERLARETGLLLVVGSSLQIWPVAGLPEATLVSGGDVAILNAEETPFDLQATLVTRGPAGPTLAGIAALLSEDAG